MFSIGDLICNSYFVYEVFDIKDEPKGKVIYIKCVYDMYKHKYFRKKENFIYTINTNGSHYDMKPLTLGQHLEYLKAKDKHKEELCRSKQTKD